MHRRLPPERALKVAAAPSGARVRRSPGRGDDHAPAVLPARALRGPVAALQGRAGGVVIGLRRRVHHANFPT
eukprot:scaffold207_cov409-Prasinococcus_capsulatus_cf.AAC.103